MKRLCLSLLMGMALAGQSVATAASSATDAESNLLILRNDKIVVGVLPRIGGRVVLLRRPDGDNVFLSDPALWFDTDVPKPGPDSGYKFYGGHVTWLGPQFHWWSQQELNPGRKGQDWPPLPYLEFSEFKVTASDASHVVMQGPDDPITGVRMTKELSLDDSGVVHVKATIVNVRDTPVSWEIWSDTRLPARTPFYIPAPSDRWFRIQFGANAPASSMVMPYEFRDGFFTFKNDTRFPRGIDTMVAKAFLRPSEGVEAAFSGKTLFLKRAPLIAPELVQPEEAFTEAYNSISRGADSNVLELEMQSEYRTLKPKDSLSFEETWQLIPYDGDSTRRSQIAFLKRLGIGAAKP